MKPRPVIALALPRAVGVESIAELADVELTEAAECDQIADRLAPELPEGFSLGSIEQAEGKPAASRVRAVHYLVDVAGDLDWDAAIHRYMAADEAVVTRSAPNKAAKRIDVRSYCSQVERVPSGLAARIELTGAGTARPEEVATAVAATLGATPTITRIVRTQIVLHEQPVGVPT